MPRPKGVPLRKWLDRGYPPVAFFSYEWGGPDDDEFFWFFKCTDREMLFEAFTLLKNGGAMEDFILDEKHQPFTVKVVSHGWRVRPLKLDLPFMDLDSIHSLLFHFFESRGVTLTLMTYSNLLNLKPKFQKYGKCND